MTGRNRSRCRDLFVTTGRKREFGGVLELAGLWVEEDLGLILSFSLIPKHEGILKIGDTVKVEARRGSRALQRRLDYCDYSASVARHAVA